MTNILKNSPKIVTLFFLLSACSKEKIANIVWQQVSPKANVAWRDVGFRNDSVAYAVGGTNWNIGMAAQTTDGGRTWRTDSVAEKQLRAVTFDADGKAYAGGIDGYLLDKTDAANPWNFYRQQHWESITDMVFYDAEHGVAVGGIAYQNGVILPIAGKNFAQIGYQLLLNELAGVCYSDANTVHAVGYGIVIRSKDDGSTWQRADIDGDFFRAVHFPTPQVGYAVGSSGTIIKTTNGGDSWNKIRNGARYSVSDVPFRAVFFLNEQRGYVVGEGGIFWRTTNGGNDWEQVKDFPADANLQNISVRPSGVGIVVSDDGRIFRFEDL